MLTAATRNAAGEFENQFPLLVWLAGPSTQWTARSIEEAGWRV